MLITLLLEQGGLLPAPLLYLSLSFKRRQQEYYDRLSAVRTDGDWEGWTAYFLDCVREAAGEGVLTAKRMSTLLTTDRRNLLHWPGVTVTTMQLLDRLPVQPIVTLALVVKLLKTSKPTAAKAIALLEDAGLLRETTGRDRDRVYAYHGYLQALTDDVTAEAESG